MRQTAINSSFDVELLIGGNIMVVAEIEYRVTPGCRPSYSSWHGWSPGEGPGIDFWKVKSISSAYYDESPFPAVPKPTIEAVQAEFEAEHAAFIEQQLWNDVEDCSDPANFIRED
jgi:hypothetical protein